MFLLNLKSIARHVAESVTNYAIKKMVDMNWQVTKYPELSFSGIGEQDTLGVANALVGFVNAGIVSPDETLEDHLRDKLELPKKPDQPKPANAAQAVVSMKERIDTVLDSIETDALDREPAKSLV